MSSFDLPAYQGQRSGSFSFTLVETISGRNLGTVHPLRDSPAKLDHDATRSIKRRLSGLVFGVEESELIDPLTHSLRVAMVADGLSSPLGTYQFAEAVYTRTTAGRMLRASGVDRGLELTEELSETFSVPASTNIGAAIRAFLELCGVTDYLVDGTASVAGAALTYPAGTARAKVLDSLAATGGLLAPWFTSLDVLRVKAAFDPATVPYRFNYDDGPIFADSITESNNLLTAPNRFRVVDNSVNADDPIVGVYDVPPSAPHSRLNLGRYVVRSEQRQGLTSLSQANEAAMALAVQEAASETFEFSVPPDPRHESFDVSRYRGVNWLELGWAITLLEGAPMTLTATKVFTL